MKAYVFPGQGAQYPGMGQELYNATDSAKEMFKRANQILGFDIKGVMFEGSEEQLKETKVTQPAIFLHSTILATCLNESFQADMVAGHSVGEISALVANKTLGFEDGLRLVSKRAEAMQKACELEPSTMAAIIGLEDNVIEDICAKINGMVVAANYNCPGQLVISGSTSAVEKACELLTTAGARYAAVLQVGGAFHSPLMEPAREELASAIESTEFKIPICPIYQNVVAVAVSDPIQIKKNLIDQLTAPVKWTQTMNAMIADGATEMIEVGPGRVLQGLFKKIDRKFPCSSAEIN